MLAVFPTPAPTPTLDGRVIRMRLPVAAVDTDPAGFSWTTPGELVMVAEDCDDPGCQCVRSFAGLFSRKATTRAVIREVPMTLQQVREAVIDCLTAGGWFRNPTRLSRKEIERVAERAAEMVEIGQLFPEGTELVRFDDVIHPA